MVRARLLTWGVGEGQLDLVAIGRQESGSGSGGPACPFPGGQIRSMRPVDSVHLKLPEPNLLSLALYSFPALSTG